MFSLQNILLIKYLRCDDKGFAHFSFFAKKLKCVKPGSSRLKNLINRAFYNENISTF